MNNPGWPGFRCSLESKICSMRMTATVLSAPSKKDLKKLGHCDAPHPSINPGINLPSAESQQSQVRLIPSLQSSPSKLRHQAIANITYHRPAIWHMLLAMPDILHPVWFCKILSKNFLYSFRKKPQKIGGSCHASVRLESGSSTRFQ